MSRPTRARGLKLCWHQVTHGQAMSRPTRARGLKLQSLLAQLFEYRSRPTRARGLKQHIELMANYILSRAPRGRVD